MENPQNDSVDLKAHKIRQALYATIGWTYQSPGQDPAIIQDMKKWRMIECRSGRFDFHASLSGIGGTGQAFHIADVTDQQTSEKLGGFRGAVISFKRDKAFAGRTIIAADKGVYNPTTVDLMSRTPFNDPNFEKIFEVYSDHEDDARALFTSSLLHKMTLFSQETLGQKLQACLVGDEIHFALEIDDNFSFATHPESTGMKFVRDLVIEAGSICVILEKLHCIQASLGRQDTQEEKKIRLEYYKKCLAKMMEVAKRLSAEKSKTGQAA